MLISPFAQAVEGHEKLRLEMQGALADIPRNLGKISKLTNVQIKRDELHQRADEVLVATFHVLERIIDRLSRTWQGKFGKVADSMNTVTLD